eukprot:GHVN01066078.1.p1 GENE.GHVN01066078.1~~GHVN01066078.1.p1  ORF type:complete len:331 (+),score=38.48 GHVN01066078.1:371-1363(+)
MDVEGSRYFASYGEVGVQGLMLRDEPRNSAYARAVQRNAERFKNHVVMDVGAGTGFLSVLAAKAGAAKVYAVEASLGAFNMLKEVIKTNGCEGIVVPVHSTVEDLSTELIVEGHNSVDIIISEWMGFYLLHESMLTSFISARDEWLKSGGFLFPQSCDVRISLTNCSQIWEEKIGWTSQPVEGIDFSCLAPLAAQAALAQPVIAQLESEHCDFSSHPIIVTWDLHKVTVPDVTHIERRVSISILGEGKTAHGFAIWFDVRFPTFNGESAVVLSTSPSSPATHWQQTTLLFAEPRECIAGLILHCDICATQDEVNPRLYTILVEVANAEVR